MFKKQMAQQCMKQCIACQKQKYKDRKIWRNIVNDDSIKLDLTIFPLFFYLSHAINFFGLLLFPS